MIKSKKARPSFTLEELEHMISLCKTQNPLTYYDVRIIQVLEPYRGKMEAALLFPEIENKVENKIEYAASCYLKSHTQVSLTQGEIEAAYDHRERNGLLSSEEIEEQERADLAALALFPATR